MSSNSTEQTENARALLNTITTNVAICVEKNKPHATATTNAWKDAMFTIEQAAKSLALLLFQFQNFSQMNASSIVGGLNSLAVLTEAESTLGNMSLVFHTDTRWKMMKKARDALKECIKTVNDIGSAGPHASSASSASTIGHTHAGMSNRDILNAPMPVIPKNAPVHFNPTGGAELKANADGTFERPALGKNIKPQNFLSFSSAESSASARLGVSGKCSMCGAVRDHTNQFCTSCGKASNIIF